MLVFTKIIFLSVPEEFAFVFCLFCLFVFALLLVPLEEMGRGHKKGISRRLGKKEKGTGMHIDTSPASLPPFPVLVLFLCIFFIFFHPLLFASTVVVPPPDYFPPYFLPNSLYTYFPRGFDECDGGTERNVSGRAGSGLAPEERVKDRRYPDSRLYVYYSDSEEQLTTYQLAISALNQAFAFYIDSEREKNTRFKIL